MSKTSATAPVTALFLDIGGVMLTNGWDRKAREAAAKKFGLDLAELNDRHRMTFDTYESGKSSLDDYLTKVVFYEDRSFTLQDFKGFMFDQSTAYPEMIALVRELKTKYGLKSTMRAGN
jgi:putative hydrolase of the HAD superfamily